MIKIKKVNSNICFVKDIDKITENELETLKCDFPDFRKKQINDFRFLKDKCSNAVGFYLVWQVLGYIPKKFYYNTNNKPYLNPDFSKGPFFNISHSGNYVFLIFDSDIDVGIDVEVGENISDQTLVDIMPMLFTQKEIEQINKKDILRDAFLSFYMLKESYLKARGTGLDFSLHSVEFEILNNKKILCSDSNYISTLYKIEDIKFATCVKK
jgi:4'-phosphopantetheinyl transferase